VSVDRRECDIMNSALSNRSRFTKSATVAPTKA
jgi:hypothetical protein